MLRILPDDGWTMRGNDQMWWNCCLLPSAQPEEATMPS